MAPDRRSRSWIWMSAVRSTLGIGRATANTSCSAMKTRCGITHPLKTRAALTFRNSGPSGTPKFSPDGKYVAYTTNESGRWEVCVSPFPNVTSRWKVSHNGGEEPRWSPDGRELYFLTPEGSRQMPTKKQIPHSAAETKNSPAWIETEEFSFRDRAAILELTSYNRSSLSS